MNEMPSVRSLLFEHKYISTEQIQKQSRDEMETGKRYKK